MKTIVDGYISGLALSLEDKWRVATKEEIESADGRKDRSNPICRKASCLYVAYSGEKIIYVGETSKSIKRRFISDGSGSHKEACSWYPSLSHVKFVAVKESELPVMYRKLIEQALAIHFKPEFYGRRTQPAHQVDAHFATPHSRGL